MSKYNDILSINYSDFYCKEVSDSEFIKLKMKIINKYCKIRKKNKVIHIFLGLPGSGKSTLGITYPNFIDPDAVIMDLPRFNDFMNVVKKKKRLIVRGLSIPGCDELLDEVVSAVLDYCIGHGWEISYATVFTMSDAFLWKLKDAGYSINVHFCYSKESYCRNRNRKEVHAFNIPLEAYVGMFFKGLSGAYIPMLSIADIIHYENRDNNTTTTENKYNHKKFIQIMDYIRPGLTKKSC